MAASHSTDLRARVLKVWEASGGQGDAAATFEVSRAKLGRLLPWRVPRFSAS